MSAGKRDLSGDEAQSAYEHAVRFASPGPMPDQRAYDYANWYDATYIYPARSLEDLPSHRSAWSRFLNEQAEGSGPGAQ